MSITKQTISFNNLKVYSLGIKVFLATNIKTRNFSVIIAAINPCSCCNLEHVSPGDVLSAINGIDLDSLDVFNNIFEVVSTKRTTINQITIIKQGILDGSDLIKRCIDPPCSEFCETWNDKFVKRPKKVVIDEKSMLLSVNRTYKIVSTKPAKGNEANSKNDRQGEPTLSEKFQAYNAPKIKFHQKIQPNSTNKKPSPIVNTPTQILNYKSTKPTARGILSEPQPMCIKRQESKWYVDSDLSSDLKQAKSLNDLTDISDSGKLSGHLSSSSSVVSLTSKRHFEYIQEIKPSKQKPVFMRKQMKPINRRSIELEDVFTDRRSDDSYSTINSVNEVKFPKELISGLEQELMRIRDEEPRRRQMFGLKSITSESD